MGLLEWATGEGESDGRFVRGSLIGVEWQYVDQGVTVFFFTGDFLGTRSLILGTQKIFSRKEFFPCLITQCN